MASSVIKITWKDVFQMSTYKSKYQTLKSHKNIKTKMLKKCRTEKKKTSFNFKIKIKALKTTPKIVVVFLVVCRIRI